MKDKEVKRGYSSARAAHKALEKILALGVIRDKMPCRVYKNDQTNLWHLTSQVKVPESVTQVSSSITPEIVRKRLEKLKERRAKSTRSAGFRQLIEPKTASAVLRDWLTGKYTAAEVANKHGLSEPAVGSLLSFYLKNSTQIKELQNNG